MTLLERMLGMGRHSSEDQPHASRLAVDPSEPVEVDPRALEAGTAPTSPAHCDDPSNIEVAAFERRISRPEIPLSQSQASTSPSSPEEAYWVEGSDCARLPPPVPPRAQRMQVEPMKAEPPMLRINGKIMELPQLKPESIETAEDADLGESGVRFARTAGKTRRQRQQKQSAIPKAYWKDLVPEGDFLERAASAILAQGTAERSKRRARTLAAATDAGRAELVVLANSMLVDVVRAQNLVIEALRLPEQHPLHQQAAGEHVHRRDPDDIIQQPKNPFGRLRVDDALVAPAAPPAHKWDPWGSRGWVKYGPNGPGPTLPQPPDVAALAQQKEQRQSWVKTDLSKVGKGPKQSIVPHKVSDLPLAKPPTAAHKPKAMLRAPQPKVNWTDSFEAAKLYGRPASPLILFDDRDEREDAIRAAEEEAGETSISEKSMASYPDAKLLSGDIVDGADMPYHPEPKHAAKAKYIAFRRSRVTLDEATNEEQPGMKPKEAFRGEFKAYKELQPREKPNQGSKSDIEPDDPIPGPHVNGKREGGQKRRNGKQCAKTARDEYDRWRLFSDELREYGGSEFVEPIEPIEMQERAGSHRGRRKKGARRRDTSNGDPFASRDSSHTQLSILRRLDADQRMSQRGWPKGKTMAEEGIVSVHADE